MLKSIESGRGWFALSALAMAACSGAGEPMELSESEFADAFQPAAAGGELDARANETGAGADSPEGEDISVEPFAVFETADFGVVQYMEPEPGALLVVATRPGEPQDGPALDSAELVRIYEEGQGEALPERFSFVTEPEPLEDEASDIQNAETGLELVPQSVRDGAAPGAQNLLGVYSESITSTQFVQNYCNSGLYAYCWIWGTGTSYSRHKARRIYGVVHAVSGRMTHRVQYKNFWGNWKTPYKVTVDGGETSWYGFITSEKRYKESRVYNASAANQADVYHHSGWFEN